MSDKPHDTSHIIQSLLSNVALSAVKFAAAFYTGSGALLAEALHTATDSLNQILLLIGVRASNKKPDATHPLGYGRELYFWSFLVALLLFSAGGLFSIYEGVHKLSEPAAIDHAWVGFAIFGFSLVLEIVVTRANIEQINAKRGDRGFLQFVQDSKESDLIVVFGENAAALLGTIFAFAAYTITWRTGDGRWDAAGSILVGVVLIGVAVFLTWEVKSLLIGERADKEISAAVKDAAIEDPLVNDVLELITVQQWPGEVLVAPQGHVQPHARRQRALTDDQRLRGARPEAGTSSEVDLRRARSQRGSVRSLRGGARCDCGSSRVPNVTAVSSPFTIVAAMTSCGAFCTSSGWRRAMRRFDFVDMVR